MGADPNLADIYGSTALLSAAREGHKDILELLLKKGSHPNIADEEGLTPIRCAVRRHAYGDTIPSILHQVLSLLDAGANPNMADPSGVVPLHTAAQEGCKEVVKLLMSRGADPNIADQDGKTPLSYAEGHIETANMLKNYGATA